MVEEANRKEDEGFVPYLIDGKEERAEQQGVIAVGYQFAMRGEGSINTGDPSCSS